MNTAGQRVPPDIPTDVPTPARMYDYCLGGKDNFAIDRAAVRQFNERFPSGLAAARENRLFLYRVVRYLARDAGIRQFLDMGSGLPTQMNVHQVAQAFQPSSSVVYVDNDPIVLAHGRALLAENDRTVVITADLTDPADIMERAEVRRLIDFSRPVAVLFLSVAHSVPEDEVVRRTLATVTEAVVPGSYLGLSQVAAETQEVAEETTKLSTSLGLPWKNRTTAGVAELLPAGLEPVDPGLVDITAWRPDAAQPRLAPVDEALRPFLTAAENEPKTLFQYGGVLRKP